MAETDIVNLHYRITLGE